MTKFLHNGELAETINLQDRGLHYGDGLFETIAVRNQQLEFWQRHMLRLQHGCRRLGIDAPDPDLLLAEARQILSKTQKAVLKIIITRGAGGRGYRVPSAKDSQTSRIISLHDWPYYSEQNTQTGVVVRVCQTRLGSNPALAGIKHLNRLEQVLARSEWQDEEIFEGFMLSAHGRVIEATMSNLFFIKAGSLCTPDLSNAGVAGIMRDVVLVLARKMRIPVTIADFKQADLETADEIFICNSLMGVLPVRQLEQQRFDVGPITIKLIDALKHARETDESHAII